MIVDSTFDLSDHVEKNRQFGHKNQVIIIGSVWIELILLKLKTENWKHCSKIIFKYVNSNMGPNFNEKVTQKWDLWVLYTVHGTTKLIKKLKSQQLAGYCSYEQ